MKCQGCSTLQTYGLKFKSGNTYKLCYFIPSHANIAEIAIFHTFVTFRHYQHFTWAFLSPPHVDTRRSRSILCLFEGA